MWYTECGVSLEEMVGFLHACSCPESQVTWEPGWDNKGGGRVGVGRVEKHRVSRLPISTNTLLHLSFLHFE